LVINVCSGFGRAVERIAAMAANHEKYCRQPHDVHPVQMFFFHNQEYYLSVSSGEDKQLMPFSQMKILDYDSNTIMSAD